MSTQLKQGEAMQTEARPPSSPRNDDHHGWMLVERPLKDGVADAVDLRPSTSSPSPQQAPDSFGEQEDGLKSPASESLADDVLREPFQAGGPLQLQLPAHPAAPTVEEPATPTGASGPHTGSCGDLSGHHFNRHHDDLAADHLTALPSSGSAQCGGLASGWAFERHHQERLRAMSRLSGEGALEGFQDPQDLLFADSAAPGSTAPIGGGDDAGGGGGHSGGVSLGWDALLSTVWCDLLRELEDVRALVAATAAALWERVHYGRLTVEEWSAAVREATHKAGKSLGRPGCPLWTLLGLSGLVAVTLAALTSQLAVNRRLTSQLRQRDKDLARLVVKILNLQDALHSASRALPVLRQASLERFTTTTTALIGMV